MNKAYDKVVWVNAPSTSSPLNQTNLNKMSDALDTVDDRVVALDSGKVGSVTVTNTLATGTTLATITVDGTATTIKGSDITVDDEMSTTSENPVQNKVIYAELQNLLPEETVAGNPISISDASGLSAKSCEVTMNPIQDLHGYDYPWAGGNGKNLYIGSPSFDGYNSRNRWELSAETLDGNEVLEKTGSWFGTSNDVPVKSGVEYTFSSMVKVSENATVYIYNANNKAIKNVSITTPNVWIKISVTFTAESDYNEKIRVETNSNTATLYISEYQLEESSTATSYAPYSNICPISGRDSLVLNQCGKNVFDLQKYLTDNNISYTKDGEWFIFSIGSSLYNNKFTLPEIAYYSGQLIIDNSRTVATNVNLRTYKNGSAVSQGTTFTNQQINQVGFNYSTTGQVCCKIQVEYGQATTEYKSYQGQTHTATFPDTVYGGSYDFVSGKLVIKYGFVDMGTLNWELNPTSKFVTTSSIGTKQLPNNTTLANILCSNYPTVTQANISSNDKSICGLNWGGGRVLIYDTAYTDAQTFKTAMSGVQLCYELANPTEITLTPETIALLKGNNTLWTDSNGNIALKYNTDIAGTSGVSVVASGSWENTAYMDNEGKQRISVTFPTALSDANYTVVLEPFHKWDNIERGFGVSLEYGTKTASGFTVIVYTVLSVPANYLGFNYKVLK